MRFDYVLVGGGLQGSLIALSVLARRKSATVALVERGQALGGNHTWCFHAADLPSDAATVVEPLVTVRWPTYEVRFPDLRRELASPYAVITSERLHEVVSAELAKEAVRARLFRGDVAAIDAHGATLDDGTRIEGRLVVDARGPLAATIRGPRAYQKFFGVELELESDAPVVHPIVFDATVPQRDGFRFLYVLPLSARRVLVEDTYYSDGPSLDEATLRHGALAYAREIGLSARRIVREERGVLPLPLRHLPRPAPSSPLVAGYKGGFFHPTTGYSFPLAIRVAMHVASRDPDEVFDAGWERLVGEHQRQARFAMLLDRWLFTATRESERWRLLSRFYRLPEATIARFYALRTTALDRARIVCGKPPRGVSLRAALSEATS